MKIVVVSQVNDCARDVLSEKQRCNHNLRAVRVNFQVDLVTSVETKPRPKMARAFAQIPGPRAFPILGTLPHYMVPNRYSLDHLHKNGFMKLKEFGPIVKEDITPGNSILWLFEADDIKKMFEVEGEFPSRISHLALEKYRLDKPEVYGNAGLLPTNGTEWAKIRSSFQFRPKVVEDLLPQFDAIARDSMDVLREISESNDGQVELMLELKKYFVEVTAMFLFGTRLGAIQANLSKSSRAFRLMNAALKTNDNILPTDNSLRLWKYFETRPYRCIREGQETIEKIESIWYPKA